LPPIRAAPAESATETLGAARIIYATNTSAWTTAIESYRIADGANDVIAKSARGQIQHITTSPDGRYVFFQRESVWSDAVLLTVTP
jgi:6-phosphogluconolactonase (cycloisomerase 2 family)